MISFIRWVIWGNNKEDSEKNLDKLDSKTANGILQSQWKEWKIRTNKTVAQKPEPVTEESAKVASKPTDEKQVTEKSTDKEKTSTDAVDSKLEEDKKQITASTLIKN